MYDGLDVCDVRCVPRCLDECNVLDVHDGLNDDDFHDVHVGRKVSMSMVSIQVLFTVTVCRNVQVGLHCRDVRDVNVCLEDCKISILFLRPWCNVVR